MNFKKLFSLFFLLLVLTSNQTFASQPKVDDGKEDYAKALELWRNRKDLDAYTLFKAAADKGICLAKQHLEHIGEADYQKSIFHWNNNRKIEAYQLLQEAAQQNHPQAKMHLYNMGDEIFKQIETPLSLNQFSTVRNLLKLAAQQGHPIATWLMQNTNNNQQPDIKHSSLTSSLTSMVQTSSTTPTLQPQPSQSSSTTDHKSTISDNSKESNDRGMVQMSSLTNTPTNDSKESIKDQARPTTPILYPDSLAAQPDHQRISLPTNGSGGSTTSSSATQTTSNNETQDVTQSSVSSSLTSMVQSSSLTSALIDDFKESKKSSDQKTWACPTCTYRLNNYTFTQCELCSALKPQEFKKEEPKKDQARSTTPLLFPDSLAAQPDQSVTSNTNPTDNSSTSSSTTQTTASDKKESTETKESKEAKVSTDAKQTTTQDASQTNKSDTPSMTSSSMTTPSVTVSEKKESKEEEAEETEAIDTRTMSKEQLYQKALSLLASNNPTKQQQAVQLLKEAAKSGHVESMVKLANCYREGTGRQLLKDRNQDDDNKLAFKWYQEAQKSNHPRGTYNLGECYLQGLGVNKDEKAAIDLYEQAMQLNDPAAMNRLGYFNQWGLVIKKNKIETSLVEKNLHKAFSLYKKAVETFESSNLTTDKLYPIALLNLGNCYENYLGCTGDEKQAKKYYEKAATLGSLQAQSRLGLYHLLGQCCCPVDKKTAVENLQKAATSKDIDAMIRLSYCQYHGIGTDKDQNAAQELKEAAIKQSNKKKVDQGWGYLDELGVAETKSLTVKKDNCGICQNDLSSSQLIWQFNCKHHFHAACAHSLLKNQSICPICRQDVTAPSKGISKERKD